VKKLTKNSLKELIRQSIYELKEGGKGSGRKAKPGGAKDIENKAMKAADDANARMDALEKGDVGGPAYPNVPRKKKKKKNESTINPVKTTVKEVKTWMKTLEENRYKKTYASDARRVSWLVNNNLSEDYESMPISMRKKWPKAAYKRERYLAKEFIKSKTDEQKLKESIRKIVVRLIND